MPDSSYSYARILARVSNLPSAVARNKTRNILGWIGCSPTPLTIQELEQALMVDIEDVQSSVRVSSSLNVIELCGPIVEVVDEYVQFVHFTVKEYVASREESENEHCWLIRPDTYSTHASTAISTTQKRLLVLPNAASGTFAKVTMTPGLRMRRLRIT
jgi:hypothetical protein